MSIVEGDPVAEGLRIWSVANEASLRVALTGGVAVATCCPSARRPPLVRDYADIDLAIHGRDARRLTHLLTDSGYDPAERFNATHGHRRLLFWDPVNGRQLDVFVDVAEMCHDIDLRAGVDVAGPNLPLADLLLMKLQVVETNWKDLIDLVAILADHPFHGPDEIDAARLAGLVGSDWGLWRTTRMVCERVPAFVDSLEGLVDPRLVVARAEEYTQLCEDAPKTQRWRLRARMGERRRWYRLPEEVT